MLTAKQEKFCQNIIRGMSKGDAYRHAYKCERIKQDIIDARAGALLKKPAVSARIDFLRCHISEQSQLLTFGLIGELEEARLAAMGAGQTSAAISAIMGKAKILGLGSENIHLKPPKIELVKFVE